MSDEPSAGYDPIPSWTPVDDSGTSYNPYNFNNNFPITGSGLTTGGALPVGGGTSGGSGFNWASLLNPYVLAGAAGPLLSMGSNLAGGGLGPQTNQTGTSLQNGSGTTTQNGTGTSNQFGTTNTFGTTNAIGNTSGVTNTNGFSNTSQQPNLLPDAQAALARLNALLGAQTPQAMDAYNAALAQMMRMAGGGTNLPAAPNTTPSPYDVGQPWEHNPELLNLIKKSFKNTTADIASSAITGARERGFAGGADLLGTAAAPIAGEALSRVPAAEVEAYLNNMLGGYTAQNNAKAQALNAATNALNPGVAAYGIGVQGANQGMQNMNSLLSLMMQPQRDMISGNLGVLTGTPHGITGATQSGGTTTNNVNTNQTSNTVGGSNTSLSGNTTNNQTGTTTNSQNGNTSGSSQVTTPASSLIGTGLLNTLSGGAQGLALSNPSNQMNTQALLSLLSLLGRG